MQEIYLLLGSNLGNREEYLRRGLVLLQQGVGEIKKASALYRTASWGKTDLPEYLNQAVCIHSDLKPRDLLTTVNLIEKMLGRQREEKWGSRTLDIDILLYGNEIVNEPDLLIPHPYLHVRKFALAPLAEIAPDILHPATGKKINCLLSELSDNLYVERFSDTTITPDMNTRALNVDLSYLNDIAGGNAEFMIDMIDIFIEQTPLYFDQLGEALSKQDWKSVGDVAHKIKPTLAFMGVEEAREQMAEIERDARALNNLEEIEPKYSSLKASCEDLYISLRKIREDLVKQV